MGPVIGFLLQALIMFLVTWLLRQYLTPEPEPLLGVYAQPGKWHLLKKCVFYLMVKLRSYRNHRRVRSGRRAGGGSGYGVQSRTTPRAMERPQTLDPAQDHALDSVYFNGVNKDGVCFIMRIGRRHQRQAEMWLSIKVPGVGFYQSPIHPDTAVYNTDGKNFNVAGLRFECLEVHKKWKVTYNGILREGLCNTWPDRHKGKLVLVKFSFIWETFSDVFDFDTDLDPWLLADAIAREKWTTQFWNNLKGKHQTHYEQWGELRGVLNIEGQEERKLYLYSCRDHSYGVRDWRSFHRYAVHFGWLEDGSTFHVSSVSLPTTSSYLKCGYVNCPNSSQHAVTSSDMELPAVGEDGKPPPEYNFSFTAGGKQYQIEVLGGTTPIYYHETDWGNIIHEVMCTFTVNGKQGWGVTEFCYRRLPGGDRPVPSQTSVPLLSEPASVPPEAESDLVLTFEQPSCCSSQLVGGKGCQLALLTQYKHQGEATFIVPTGFCLAIAAFKRQLEVNSVLEKHLTNLANIACGNEPGSLQSACQEAVSAFVQCPLCPDVQQAIETHMQQVFTSDWQQLGFAVRSSATGEDSDEMSAAGQMATILGVTGLQQVYEAVKQCWSSHFSFTAVEYRRQHGQPIYSTMGVVIQEMVPAEAAGVLFTKDPATRDPSTMTINANYGLGESVVSGSSEPDTIYVQRSTEGQVKVTRRDIGSKKTQVIATAAGSTAESQVSADLASQCCVSDEMVLKLARIGLELEKSFSDARDIEWAMANGQIYLLQARPVTTLEQETEWELLHEFDTPRCTDREMLTKYNVGEVMPGLLTPLTITAMYMTLEKAMQKMLVDAGVHSQVRPYHKFMSMCCNEGFLNLSFLMSMCQQHILGNSKKIAELSLCGYPLEDFTLEEVIEYNGCSPMWRRVLNAIRHWRNMLGAYNRIQAWAKRLLSYDFKLDGATLTAGQLYEALNDRSVDMVTCWNDHVTSSAISGAWSTTLMAVVTQGKHEWTAQHYADVAMLLSKCEDVHSADVPTALQKLAAAIRKVKGANTFIQMEPEEAVSWLQSGESGEAGTQYRDFMVRHGHRCIKECELHEKSWESQPTKIIGSLQALLEAPEMHDSSAEGIADVGEAIASIKSPTTAIGRLVLKFTLPRARRAVGAREWGKTTAVRLVDKFKQGYWKLAALMVEEGRLPDADLLFFLTNTEIGKLLKSRSGRLILRAQRRRRLMSQQPHLEFPLLQRGHPKPVEESLVEDFVVTSLKTTGMPVSQGSVQGIARIVKSLEDAHTIEAGDVLVVKTTDVGWSPYFPVISGLVTEMGGLLSHGAVVAREYGIPCVVNVNRATVLFRSGEKVLLNGTTGTLEKIED